MFLADFGVPIASSCYRCIKFTHLLHLMCSLFVMFESRLNWNSPTPFFLCSQVLSFFCFRPRLTGTHNTLFFSALMCSLSCCFGPGLTGTHPCFSGMLVLGWFWCPDSQKLLSLHQIHPFIASHMSLVCNVWVPAQLGLTHPLLSLLSCALFLFALIPA